MAVGRVAVSPRVAPASALTSAVPAPQDRGAFIAVSSSLQQFSGGVASAVAGLIVFQAPGGRIERYDILGFVVIGAISTTVALMYPIHRSIRERARAAAPPAGAGGGVSATG